MLIVHLPEDQKMEIFILHCLFAMVTLRVVVNGSISKGRPLVNGISQGSVSRPMLFNIFVGDMDNAIESTFSKFADNTTMCGAVDMLQ